MYHRPTISGWTSADEICKLECNLDDCSGEVLGYTMERLMREEMCIRDRCDLSLGLEHFRTPVSKGIEIIEGLRGHTSGYAVPTFVVDAPGGGGKTPVMPNYVISQTPGKVILRNYEGVITTYTEPAHYEPHCTCDVCTGKRKANVVGVAALEQGLQTVSYTHLDVYKRQDFNLLEAHSP